MKPATDPDIALKKQLALIEELEGQSDRAAAIVGAAWIEESLTIAIEDALAKDAKAWHRLFGPNGPLDSFSAKIDLGKLLDLMTDSIRSDLHIVRDIRNEFAHHIVHKKTLEKLSFDSMHIRDKCFALNCIAAESLAKPRMKFIRACAVLSSDFELLPLFRSPNRKDAKVSVKGEDAA